MMRSVGWLTFDLEVSGALGVSSRVRHLAGHGHFAVVEDQRVLASFLDDVHILLNKDVNSLINWLHVMESAANEALVMKHSQRTD